MNQSINQSINSSINSSSQKVKMYTLNYDPGQISGHVVLKSVKPVNKQILVIVDYKWEEHDIGDWRGVHKVQVPVYETQTVTEWVPTGKWTVYTEEEYQKYEAMHSS